VRISWSILALGFSRSRELAYGDVRRFISLGFNKVLSVAISIQCSLLVSCALHGTSYAQGKSGLANGSSLPPRARYSLPTSESTLQFTPVNLGDGSRLTLISPSSWSDISKEISGELTTTHQQLTSLFGSVPAFRTAVRLLDEQSFYKLTGAPSWTNAMFYRGEIIIPLSTSETIDLDNLHRSVKHEYSHAVLSALSGGSIPGWLDEGLAQWIEGDENPALRNTLRVYLNRADPIPLKLLQGGFTKLTPKMVPAAYAQSLLAAQALLKVYGIEKIGIFLGLLRNQISKDSAFETSFGLSEREFEERLGSTLRAWAGDKR
jgi:hypothetical protein